MQFTRFLLDNYLATAEGTQALHFFQNLPQYVVNGDSDNNIAKFIDDLLLMSLPDGWYSIQNNEPINDFNPVAIQDKHRQCPNIFVSKD
ncbi:MAG: hypothetical protein LBV80_04610 [Deltaproteobacteria bacterium]|jgi:hypothetical protein|nr:hypothetical protein [Deltaproteobacteria bacterium]